MGNILPYPAVQIKKADPNGPAKTQMLTTEVHPVWRTPQTRWRGSLTGPKTCDTGRFAGKQERAHIVKFGPWRGTSRTGGPVRGYSYTRSNTVAMP